MRLIDTPVARGLRGHLLRTWIVVLCAVLAASHAVAQEGAPAAADATSAEGGPGDGAALKGRPEGAAANRDDVELVAPRRESAGLWRRANVKTLIANVSGATASSPAANIRIGPPPLRPGIGVSASRKATGIALPGAQRPSHALAGVTTGTSSTGIGTPAANIPPVRAPANAGPALHGAAINGTTMGRVAKGSGSIGGPARDRSGINGTLMRPKY